MHTLSIYSRLPCAEVISLSNTLRSQAIRFRSYSSTSPHMASLKRKAGPLTGSPGDQKKPKKDATLTSFFGAPKTSPSATKTNGAVAAEPAPVKFDVEKWTATLSPEQKSLLKLEIDTLHPSWLAHLKDELTSNWFLELKKFLQKEIDSGKKIFPPLEDVYSWYVFTFVCGTGCC